MPRMKVKKHLSFGSLRNALSKAFLQIPEWRQDKKVAISLHDALMSGFACMHFQHSSLLNFQQQMQDAMKKNNLMSLFGIDNIPKETQMREIIDRVSSTFFEAIFKEFYARLQRGKYLERYQIFPKMYYFPIDGSEFFHSNEVHCSQCLLKRHGDSSKTYSHQVLQGGIMHPDCKQIIPFMPEQIVNGDGETKQDCEMNAAKRFVVKLRKNFPKLDVLIGGDALFSKQPIIELILENKMHYLFVAKPTDHVYMMDYLNAYPELNHCEFVDELGRTHYYEWMNQVPLTGNKKSMFTNFFRCTIRWTKKKKKKESTYKNSWVTDQIISNENIRTLVKAGRCRWKNENECFNAMKNQGYFMGHNYGHGHNNLAFNFYLLTLLAFMVHQIFELTDSAYRAYRLKCGKKQCLWETFRTWINTFVFSSWEQLLRFGLSSERNRFDWAQAP